MFSKYAPQPNQPAYAQAKSYCVGAFFEEHLREDRTVKIPGFQRDYVWGKEEIEALLNDVAAQWRADSADRALYHPIGTICCARHESSRQEPGSFSVVDGQQRLTTLYLTTAAAANLLEEKFGAEAESLRRLLRYRSDGIFTASEKRYVLNVTHGPARRFLESVADGEYQPDAHRTVAPYEAAYRDIGVWLEGMVSKSGATSEVQKQRLCDYIAFLLGRVTFVAESVPDWDAARVFSLRNTRGVTLTELDNLKADLYRLVEPEQYREFFQTWEEMRDLQHEAGLATNSDRFLRLAVQSRQKKVSNPTTARKAVRRYAKKHGAFKAVEDILSRTARDYKALLEGKNLVSREESPALMGLRGANLLRSHKQLHATYLAAADLDAEQFEELARVLADFTDFVKLALFPTDWEDEAKTWPEKVRNGAIVEIESAINDIKIAHAESFAAGVMQLSADGGNAEFVRRILGRASVAVCYWGDYRSKRDFWNPDERFPRARDASGKRQWEIEHIRPQSRLELLDPEDWQERNAITCLGNLTLLEQPLNAAAGDRPFDEKKEFYISSSNLLTQAIVQPVGGAYTKEAGKWVGTLRHWDQWARCDIRDRQMALFGLLSEIYGMDDLCGMTEESWGAKIVNMWGPDHAPSVIGHTKHIPQTTSENALAALEFLAGQPDGVTAAEVMRGMRVEKRQVDWMLDALEGLELARKDADKIWTLTDAGLAYHQASDAEKRKIITSAILRSPVYRVVLRAESREEAEDALKALKDVEGKSLGSSTAHRRLGSIPSWLELYHPDPGSLQPWLRSQKRSKSEAA